MEGLFGHPHSITRLRKLDMHDSVSSSDHDIHARSMLKLNLLLAKHYSDVIMSAMASQITGVSIVCSAFCSGTDQRKHQSSASLTFVTGIHRTPVDSPHKGPVTRNIFPFDDVIMHSISPCRVLLWSHCGHSIILFTPLLSTWRSTDTRSQMSCSDVNKMIGYQHGSQATQHLVPTCRWITGVAKEQGPVFTTFVV